MNLNKICIIPWNVLRISSNGDCFFCTPNFNEYKLGNIIEQDLKDIYNGEIANQIRKSVLDNQYTYCKTDLCNFGWQVDINQKLPEQFYIPTINSDSSEMCSSISPSIIYFSHDYSCKQKCVFCRDNIKMMSDKNGKLLYDAIYKKILPIINNVKIVEFMGEGEFIDSIYSVNLIKEIIRINPNIKFHLISNGVGLTKEKLEEIGIINNIEKICVSIHAANKNTYKKIFRKDNFDLVMKNLEFLSEWKQEKKLKILQLMFVICSLNYKDIKSFIKLSKKYNAEPSFSIINDSGTDYTKNEYEYNVCLKNNKNYNSFVNIIQSKEVKEYLSYFPNYVKSLKKNNIIDSLKNFFN